MLGRLRRFINALLANDRLLASYAEHVLDAGQIALDVPAQLDGLQNSGPLCNSLPKCPGRCMDTSTRDHHEECPIAPVCMKLQNVQSTRWRYT